MSEYQAVLLRQLGEEISETANTDNPAVAIAYIFMRRPILAHALINAF